MCFLVDLFGAALVCLLVDVLGEGADFDGDDDDEVVELDDAATASEAAAAAAAAAVAADDDDDDDVDDGEDDDDDDVADEADDKRFLASFSAIMQQKSLRFFRFLFSASPIGRNSKLANASDRSPQLILIDPNK